MPEETEFFNGFDDDILNPDEFKEEESEEKTETETKDDDKSEEVEKVETKEEDSETADESDEKVKTQAQKEADEKARELHEKNEREKAKRLAREQKEREEREQKIKKDAKLEAELGLIKKNPYTDEPIKDEEDLKIYKIQKEIDDNGGDPVNDLAKALAENNRKVAKEEKEKANAVKEAQDKMLNEVNGFHKRHPEISQKYLMDNGFGDVVDDYDSDMSYAERVYDFVNKLNSAKQKSDEKKEKEIINENGKRMTKVPSSNSNGGKSGNKSYMDMSDEEYLKYEKDHNQDFF